MSHTADTDRQVWHLLELLVDHPHTMQEIRQEFRCDNWHAYWLMSLLRNEYSEDVIITDWRSFPPVYRTAESGGEALIYVNRRVHDVRARTRNVLRLADLGINSFPDHAPLVEARANLSAVSRVLNGSE